MLGGALTERRLLQPALAKLSPAKGGQGVISGGLAASAMTP
jgi:hypothetical protein